MIHTFGFQDTFFNKALEEHGFKNKEIHEKVEDSVTSLMIKTVERDSKLFPLQNALLEAAIKTLAEKPTFNLFVFDGNEYLIDREIEYLLSKKVILFDDHALTKKDFIFQPIPTSLSKSIELIETDRNREYHLVCFDLNGKNVQEFQEFYVEIKKFGDFKVGVKHSSIHKSLETSLEQKGIIFDQNIDPKNVKCSLVLQSIGDYQRGKVPDFGFYLENGILPLFTRENIVLQCLRDFTCDLKFLSWLLTSYDNISYVYFMDLQKNLRKFFSHSDIKNFVIKYKEKIVYV